MIIQNIRHEIRLLSRNYWFIALAVIFTLLSLYAGINGTSLYESRNSELEKAKLNQSVLTDRIWNVAKAIENGENPDDAYRLTPIATGTLAIMQTNPLSALAIGQSDLYTHQIKISAREDLATLTFNEMSNPVQLLFGNFDLVFVLTYLIPLIIIAFTYNLQSQELESGRLKLLASNPINPKIWLFQRYFIRFVSLSLVLALAIFITIFVFNIGLSFRLFNMGMITFAYICFWFCLSFIVNVFGTSSGNNAVILLSFWIVLVLIIPAAISQTGQAIYPSPSRVALLNEIRQTKLNLGKEQDKVLAEYLRNHPELARSEGENQFAYWQGFFASQEIMENELSPLIDRFDRQLQEQQKWVNTWRFLSPAIVFQSSFTELAGTSGSNYSDYKNSVKTFTKGWRAYFMPMVFNNRMLTLNDLENLPSFEYKSTFNRGVIAINVAVLMLFSTLLFIVGFRRKNVSFVV